MKTRRSPPTIRSLSKSLKWILLSLCCGIFAGLAATVFLYLLDLATLARDAHPNLIWLLPFAGFMIGWIYHVYGKDVAAGNNLILEEIHDPKNVTPFRMSPLILIGTILTHLCGGSAGREGTAVQMGASLSDQLSRFFNVGRDERKILLVAGAGAGFGAAVGAPWAGVIFGMEVINVGRLKPFAVIECLIASFTALAVTSILKAPHSHYPSLNIADFNGRALIGVALAGVAFGLTARAFSLLTHAIERLERQFIRYPPLKPAAAGLLLVILYAAEGSYRYVGLGIPFIQEALTQPATFTDPFFKTLFTALTVGSGFKGGEFVPLVFIGTTLGSALSIVLPVSFQLLASVGFAAVFAGASKTPIACTVMAAEIFGWQITPYALIACVVSYAVSGRDGIYRAQRR